MFGSNRIGQLTLALVALVCAIFMAGVMYGLVSEQYAKVHQVNAAYQKNADADRKKANYEIAHACHGRDFITFRNCVSDKLEAYYKEQTTNEDLKAQKDMAFWAGWLLILTVFSILISLAGLYLLLDSLRQTRRSISDTREIGQAQVRAYITCISSEVEISDGVVSLKPKFQNTGESPTSPLTIDADLIFGSNNTLYNLGEGLSGRRIKAYIGSCPAVSGGGSTTGKIMGFGDEITTDIKLLGPGHFTVDGTAEWHDVFGKQCSLKFTLDIEHIERQIYADRDVVYEGTMTASNQQFRVLEKQAHHHQ